MWKYFLLEMGHRIMVTILVFLPKILRHLHLIVSAPQEIQCRRSRGVKRTVLIVKGCVPDGFAVKVEKRTEARVQDGKYNRDNVITVDFVANAVWFDWWASSEESSVTNADQPKYGSHKYH